MTDAVHDPLPSRFQPAPEFLAEVISHANYPKKLLVDNRS
jgi:hypothetical protein